MNDPRVWRIARWEDFQHYSKRNPPWIKLHRKLLQDPDWFELTDYQMRVLVNCWMLAASHDTPGMLATCKHIAFNLHTNASDLLAALEVLEAKGFIEDASKVLAPRKQVASPEGEGETEREAETEAEAERAGAWGDGISDSLWEDLRARGATPAYRKRWAKYLTPTVGPCAKLDEGQRVAILEDAIAATLAESKAGELPSVPFLDSAVDKRARAAISANRPSAAFGGVIRDGR